jgi:hypothetical protein
MNNSKLFAQAHALTKKIRKAGDNYRVTFGACLRYVRATEGKFVTLSGKTYNCRALIQKHGGTFNAAAKTWTMPVRGWDHIRRLDNGRAVWGVIATPAGGNLVGDWRTNPAFGYVEAV